MGGDSGPFSHEEQHSWPRKRRLTGRKGGGVPSPFS